MAMLEGEPELTLELLNRATQAWVEQEYNQHVHSETGRRPISCEASPDPASSARARQR